MAVMDEFKEEREAIKHGTPKEKLIYFFDYYKWYVIIAVSVILVGIYILHEFLDRKDTALYTCLLNSLELDASGYNAGFAEAIGLNTDDYELIFDADTRIDPDSMDEITLAHSQKLIAHLAAGELDVMITDAESLTKYSYQQDFFTMEDLLSPQQYQKYEPYFYYIDMAALEEWQAFINDYNNLTSGHSFDFPDPRKPEEMESPVAMGIFLDECGKFKECYHFQSDDVVFSVFANTSRKETALQYLDYIMQ